MSTNMASQKMQNQSEFREPVLANYSYTFTPEFLILTRQEQLQRLDGQVSEFESR
jgi:hypothetical protein